jgi:hypothetical protein
MTTPTVQPGGLGNSFNTITITLASLASDTNLLAGREATALANGSNLYADAEVNGKITCGTTPTTNTSILVYGFVALDDTPTWPDAMTGSDANASVTSTGVGLGYLRLIAGLSVDSTTSNRAYPFTCSSLARVFGFNLLGKNWSIFVVHNTGVNLNATGGNHVVKYRGFNPIIPSV